MFWESIEVEILVMFKDSKPGKPMCVFTAPPHARDDCKDAGADADADAGRGWRWRGSRAPRVRRCAHIKKSQVGPVVP